MKKLSRDRLVTSIHPIGEKAYSRKSIFVLCSAVRTARSIGYTGLILRETQLQLPVTASNKSTQHTYRTLRCRGPLRSHTPLYRGVRKGKTRDFATVSFRECEPSRQLSE